ADDVFFTGDVGMPCDDLVARVLELLRRFLERRALDVGNHDTGAQLRECLRALPTELSDRSGSAHDRNTTIEFCRHDPLHSGKHRDPGPDPLLAHPSETAEGLAP